MNTEVKKQVKQILVEYLTDVGSAFAITEEGEQVTMLVMPVMLNN